MMVCFSVGSPLQAYAIVVTESAPAGLRLQPGARVAIVGTGLLGEPELIRSAPRRRPSGNKLRGFLTRHVADRTMAVMRPHGDALVFRRPVAIRDFGRGCRAHAATPPPTERRLNRAPSQDAKTEVRNTLESRARLARERAGSFPCDCMYRQYHRTNDTCRPLGSSASSAHGVH